MKKVTLINPPQPNSLDDRLDPPLGLMYIGASLKSRGIDTRIVDLSQTPKTEWKEKIGYADVYGTTVFTPSFYLCKEINQLSMQNNPNAILVAGGPHPTSLPNQTISEGNFDYVIKGQGEYAFPSLIESLESGVNVPKIIDAKPITDLDSLEFPAREMVNLSSYHRKVNGEPATTLISSRGCPYSCSFCCKDVHGRQVNFRSIPNF